LDFGLLGFVLDKQQLHFVTPILFGREKSKAVAAGGR
jgi:hypothetical protein